jgi:hypothetical protein
LENLIDIIKSELVVTNAEGIGKTETSGKETKNKIFKLTMKNGGHAIFKPSLGEHVSSWRYIPAHQAYIREYVAYLVDRELGFYLVPETKIAMYLGKKGSLQDWVDGLEKSDKTLKKYSEENIWKMGLLDLVLASVDRHSRNWQDKGSVPVAIDNGYSLPYKAGAKDRRSVILSRFAFNIWGKRIPWNLRMKLNKLNYYSFKGELMKYLDKPSLELMYERINTMVKTGIAAFPKYRVLRKLMHPIKP